MSISSIANSILYNSELLSTTSNTDEESPLEKLIAERNGTSSSTTDETVLSPGRKLLRASSSASEALATLKANGLAVTQENVEQEIEQKETEFQLLVKTSLKALGVDEDIEFKIALDENGKIVVNSSHEDKSKVQNFFDNTPALADEFKSIESLKNLQKNMQDSRGVDATSIRRSIQLENMDAYFQGLEEGQSSSSPLILAYSKNSIMAMAGINLSV